MAVSHIMLEAYKKYILVSLILHGKVQPLPKYTSQIVGRFIKVRASSTDGMSSIMALLFSLTAVTFTSADMSVTGFSADASQLIITLLE